MSKTNIERYRHGAPVLKTGIGEILFDGEKIVKKIEPIIPNVTTYFARHTWATFASELDIPFDTISQALGHSTGNKTTLIYIKFDQSKIDAANRAVIDWIEVDELSDTSRGADGGLKRV